MLRLPSSLQATRYGLHSPSDGVGTVTATVDHIAAISSRTSTALSVMDLWSVKQTVLHCSECFNYSSAVIAERTREKPVEKGDRQKCVRTSSLVE